MMCRCSFKKNWLWLVLILCTITLHSKLLLASDNTDLLRKGFSLNETFAAFGTEIDTILISGNNITKDVVIRQELHFREGDTLTADQLRQSEQQVFNLQLFNTVHISAKRFSPSDTSAASPDLIFATDLGRKMTGLSGRAYTVVVVSVRETWYIYPIPQVGLRGTGTSQWVRKPTISNINAGISFQDRNFSGYNDLMAVTFGVGFDPFVGFSYASPYLFGSNRTGFSFTVNYSKLRNLADIGTTGFAPGYSQTSLNLNISVNQRLSLFQLVGASVEYNAYTVDSKTHTAYPSSTISPDGKDLFFSVGAFYRYQHLDFILFPMQGVYLNLTASQIGLAGIPDKIGFTRGSLDARVYQKIIGNLSIGIRNYSLVSTNNPVPNHQRLFIGYTTQIRGYTSTILNGDNIQLNSIELRHPIIKLNAVKLDFIPIERLSIVQYGLFITAFLDGGTIWYSSKSPAPSQRLTRFSFSDYKYGYGAGLVFVAGRWTARLDAAFNDHGKAELVFEKTVSF